jgi:hypothetical protein
MGGIREGTLLGRVLDRVQPNHGCDNGLNNCTATPCSDKRSQIACHASQANCALQYTVTSGLTQTAAISNIVAAVQPNNPAATTTTTSPANTVEFKGQVSSEIDADGKIKATIKLPEGYSHGQFRFNTKDSIKSEGSWLGLSGKSSTSSDYTKVSIINKGDGTLQVELGKERSLVEIQVRDDKGNVSTIKLSRSDITRPATTPENPAPGSSAGLTSAPSSQPAIAPASQPTIVTTDSKELGNALARGTALRGESFADKAKAEDILNKYGSAQARGQLISSNREELVEVVRKNPASLDLLLKGQGFTSQQVKDLAQNFFNAQSDMRGSSNKQSLNEFHETLRDNPGYATLVDLAYEVNHKSPWYRLGLTKTGSMLEQLKYELGAAATDTVETDLGKFETATFLRSLTRGAASK